MTMGRSKYWDVINKKISNNCENHEESHQKLQNENIIQLLDQIKGRFDISSLWNATNIWEGQSG